MAMRPTDMKRRRALLPCSMPTNAAGISPRRWMSSQNCCRKHLDGGRGRRAGRRTQRFVHLPRSAHPPVGANSESAPLRSLVLVSSKSERRVARSVVAEYHQAELGKLVAHVGEAVDGYRAGELDPF